MEKFNKWSEEKQKLDKLNYDNFFYYKLSAANFNEENKKHENSSYCILSQVRVMDKKRFTDKIWYIKNNEFIKIKEKLKEFLL